MGGPSYEKQIAELEKEADEYADYLSEEEEGEIDVFDEEKKNEILRDFSMCIVVGGLPVVKSDKHPKLLNVVKKIFSQAGKIIDLDMPLNSNDQTTGFAFVEYESELQANIAIKSFNDFALDKRHTLKVSPYSDIEKYLNAPETYTPPKIEDFKEPRNLKTWLTDEAKRDMFALRYGNETEIYWSDKGEISLAYDGHREKQNGKKWCSQYVLWSPQGTYLATFHPQGIALWGGENWEKIQRFAHKQVRIALFSPNEKYLITCNDVEGDNAIIVWDVSSGKILRAFPSGKPASAVKSGEVVQGLMTPFKWSYNGDYVARRGKDVISVYQLPSMKLVDKKSLRADGVHDFFWSPTDNYISYWSPETSNVPARVTLVEMPTRREVRQKNLFNVSSCKLHWHPSGNYLCVKVTRHSKSKKTQYTNFELFRIRDKLVPVEMKEMKDTVAAFSWEPKGSRFAVVHGDGPQKFSASLFDMKGGAKKNEATMLYTLTDKSCSHLYWSPLGNNIVLAGLGEMNGVLEFWDVDEEKSISIQEHFKCTNVEWDPSGRVVASAVCQPIDNTYYKFQMDNGYNLWTFQGKNLMEEKKDHFYQFLWRPRPRSLLSDKEYAKVVKNLKKYEKKFYEMDRQKERAKKEAEEAAKAKKEKEFQDLMAERRALARERRAAYIELLDGYDSEDDSHYIIETREYNEIISKKEEVVEKL